MNSILINIVALIAIYLCKEGDAGPCRDKSAFCRHLHVPCFKQWCRKTCGLCQDNRTPRFYRHPKPIDGGLVSEWGEWSKCSASCGEGFKTRRKSCSNPAPQFGGKPCQSHPMEKEACDLPLCIVAAFYSYSTCNANPCVDGDHTTRCFCEGEADGRVTLQLDLPKMVSVIEIKLVQFTKKNDEDLEIKLMDAGYFKVVTNEYTVQGEVDGPPKDHVINMNRAVGQYIDLRYPKGKKTLDLMDVEITYE